MRSRSRFPTILALIFGGLALSAGVLGYGAYRLVRAVGQISLEFLAASLQQVASIVSLLLASELATAAVVWATQGPIPAIGWSVSRVLAWQGF